MTEPLLTVLNYSGGKQSSRLLWGVLRNEIPVDRDHFVVLNADPGMENSGTYVYIKMMEGLCAEMGITFIRVPGPNLYQDILTLHQRRAKRLDNPPYWTKDRVTGKRGRLKQKCTYIYKIAPMDRAIRILLEEKWGISRKSKRVGVGSVVKWIGFSYSEIERIKPPKQKYIVFRYPLIDLKETNADVLEYYRRNNLPIPPRSVCNACFANGLSTLK